MSDKTNTLLQQAYALIANDKHDEAQAILAPLLEDDAENAHLWWVYTHAVHDTAIGQAALERVLSLDPKYPGARELKADVLEAQAKDPDLIALEASETDGAFRGRIAIDDWEDLQPVADAAADSSPGRGRLIALVVALLLIAGGAVVISGAVDLNELLSGLLPSPEPLVIVVSEATAEPAAPDEGVAAKPAEDEAIESSAAKAEASPVHETNGASANAPVATEAGAAASPRSDQVYEASAEATAELTGDDEEDQPTTALLPEAAGITYIDPPVALSYEEAAFVTKIADAIEGFKIDQTQSASRRSSLGKTLFIQACAIPGPEFNERLNALMNAVVSFADDLPDEVEAFGAGLLNCDDPDASLRIIGVARSSINDFASDGINAKEFQRAWQPLS
jgi:hypothetical protein